VAAVADRGEARVDLLWIPLGAGAHVVRISGAVYEAVAAALDRRRRCPLFHSALQIEVDGIRWVIESTPVPDERGRTTRGVVGEGPVGLRALGRLRLFRYEIRRWAGGAIPDAWAAVGGPVPVSEEPERAHAVLERVPAVPTPVWGRDQLRTGEMWNSNSLTSWLLAGAGIDASALRPPNGGRAPGWDAGIAVAARRSG
jgi:hypothetical protein